MDISMSIRNGDSFKKEMATFWGLPSFGENVKNGGNVLGFIGFSYDFMTANRPNANPMPFLKTTTVPPVNRPFQWKNPNSSRLSAYFMDLAEDVSTTSPRKTPVCYARNTGTNKLTVTVTFETTSVTPVTKVLTKLCCPLRATLTKPPIFRNFLLCKKS